MTSHPTADELLQAVSGFIERIAPTLDDRDVFLARVAVNALSVVRREMTARPKVEAAAAARLQELLHIGGDFAVLNGALCDAIRSGLFDQDEGELLSHLRALAIDQVGIDQPTYSGLKTALLA